MSEECFLEHVASPDFQAGVASGWWGLEPGDTWPHAVLWIAAPPRAKGPDRYHFRFYLQDYPSKGPTAMLWDPIKKAKPDADKRPKGTGFVALLFRTDWNEGNMLYAPWDRLAYENHPEWPPKHAHIAWKPTRSIVYYLQKTKEALDSEEYLGS